MPEPLIEVRRVSKRFGGTVALEQVEASFASGEIHGLIGENGAGKSTLGKIICGRLAPDDGSLLIDGAPVRYRRPQDAAADGIAAVAQELAVLPHRSVLDNALCGNEPRRLGFIDSSASLRRYRELAEKVGLLCEPATRTGELDLADQQKVEIMRALNQGARAILFDEPTAKLPAGDGERLLRLMRQLAEDGTAVILISHFLEEVLATCSAVTLMRDGRLVRTARTSEETVSSLVGGMLGRDLDQYFPAKNQVSPDAEVLLHAVNVSSPPRVRDVSIDVRAGEVVGMFGLVGSGRSEFARSVMGVDVMTRGSAEICGRHVGRSVRSSIQAGVAMIPESRKTQGLLLNRTVAENIALPHLDHFSRLGWMVKRSERRRVREMAEAVGLKANQLGQPAGSLSGGNQQKVLFARWLLVRPDVLLVDEPTRGVDIGAKRNIYDLLADQTARGMGILLISSELDEIINIPQRTVVLRSGCVAGEVVGTDLSNSSVLSLAFAEPGPEERQDHV